MSSDFIDRSFWHLLFITNRTYATQCIKDIGLIVPNVEYLVWSLDMVACFFAKYSCEESLIS